MNRPDRTGTPEERLNFAVERVNAHISRVFLNWRQKEHLRAWTREAAHAVFETHPELREEGSLPRYFVARVGREKGLRGTALTQFVEREYREGTWWKHVPEDVLLGKPKATLTA